MATTSKPSPDTPESKEDGWLDHDPLFPPEAEAGFEDLLGQVDKDVKGWLPKSGDKLFGKVLEIDTANGDFGEYPLITVETPSGKLVGLHCFHQVLRNEVTKKINNGRLAIGWDIAVMYKGEGEAKGGNAAPNMYRVATRPPAEVVPAPAS